MLQHNYMKKFLLLLLVGLSATSGFAQCDKKVVLTASRTEYLDATGTLQRSVDEHTVIELGPAGISITPGREENRMTGTIKSNTCNWTVPFKEGKSVIKSVLTDDRNAARNVTLTIEGKDGKVTLLAEVDEMPDRRIRVLLDKFEEVK